MNKNILAEFKIEQEPDQCKGKIYRLKINNFINSKGEIIFQQRFIPMKKLSCPGCSKCGFLMDDLKERDFEGIKIEKPENGKLYEMIVANISRDWESGVVDDWDLMFSKIKE